MEAGPDLRTKVNYHIESIRFGNTVFYNKDYHKGIGPNRKDAGTMSESKAPFNFALAVLKVCEYLREARLANEENAVKIARERSAWIEENVPRFQWSSVFAEAKKLVDAEKKE